MVPEEVFNPLADVIRHIHPRIFVQYGTVTYAVKCLGEIQGIHYDVWVSGKVGGDSVQQLNESCGSGTIGLDSKLIMKTEPRWWRSKWRVDYIFDDDTLQDPGKNWDDRNWPIVSMLKWNA